MNKREFTNLIENVERNLKNSFRFIQFDLVDIREDKFGDLISSFVHYLYYPFLDFKVNKLKNFQKVLEEIKNKIKNSFIEQELSDREDYEELKTISFDKFLSRLNDIERENLDYFEMIEADYDDCSCTSLSIYFDVYLRNTSRGEKIICSLGIKKYDTIIERIYEKEFDCNDKFIERKIENFIYKLDDYIF